jgi:phage repressor protein C with HTH and peptisase S24 domain
MLSHAQVWAAIDALAARHSLSASGLARKAGLDSTAFNKSKRLSADGRPRWTSTESQYQLMDGNGGSLAWR